MNQVKTLIQQLQLAPIPKEVGTASYIEARIGFSARMVSSDPH